MMMVSYVLAHRKREPTQALQCLVPHEMRIPQITQIHKDDCRHIGLDHVFAQVYKNFYWSGMREDIKSWLVACKSYQRAKTGIGCGRIKIKHERVAKPGVHAAMDLAVMPVTQEGYKYLLVYQDYYSKFIELLPLMVKTPKAVAKLLVTEIFTHVGLCNDLHSDQGKEFDGRLMHV